MDYSSHSTSDPGIVSGSFQPAASGPNKRVLLLIGGALVALILVVSVVTLLLNKNGALGTAADINRIVAKVGIEPGSFTPTSIKIKLNQQITYTNDDAMPHQLAADQSMLPGFATTEVLQKGDSYTYTFDKKGTFRYYDPANPKIFVGTVVVE